MTADAPLGCRPLSRVRERSVTSEAVCGDAAALGIRLSAQHTAARREATAPLRAHRSAARQGLHVQCQTDSALWRQAPPMRPAGWGHQRIRATRLGCRASACGGLCKRLRYLARRTGLWREARSSAPHTLAIKCSAPLSTRSLQVALKGQLRESAEPVQWPGGGTRATCSVARPLPPSEIVMIHPDPIFASRRMILVPC